MSCMTRDMLSSMKKPAMTIAEMGRLGGHARAAKLTPARRKQIASRAAKARWKVAKQRAA